MSVICRDLGDDVSKWSRVDVAVDVAPPNDHAPRFERLRYDCHVTENAADDVIATVKAVDVDSGPSGQVKQRCKTTFSRYSFSSRSFSALTLLVGHPACKKLEWWGTGMVICLERGAVLHMAQLMPLPLAVSCISKIQSGFCLSGTGSPG